MLYLALVFRILGSWFTVEIGKKTQLSDLEEPDPIQLYSLLPSRSPYMSVSLSLSPTVVEKKDQRGRERERGGERMAAKRKSAMVKERTSFWADAEGAELLLPPHRFEFLAPAPLQHR